MVTSNNKMLAGLLIFVLGIGIAIAAYEFLPAIIGAVVLFTLFNPIYKYFTDKKKWRKEFVAGLIIVVSFIIIILPLLFIGSLAVQEVLYLSQQRAELQEMISDTVSGLEEQFPNLEISQRAGEVISSAISYLQSLLAPLLQQATAFVLNTVIMYFILFYMLVESALWKKKLYEFIPFSELNSKKLIDQFAKVTNSTIVSTGVIAIIQGLLIGFSFWIVGIRSPVLWGMLGSILSFLPILGTPILWIPASIYLLFTGQYAAGIGLVLFSAILTSNIDNILRPILNKSFAQIHPLTTLVGVFMGLYLFGIMGIFLGPLLISYFFQTVEMYKEEHM